MLTKQGEFSFKHVDQPDVPMPGSFTPEQWKGKLDSQTNELKATLNKLIDDLEANTGTSGAEQIGSKGITDLTGTTVYALMKDLRDQLKSVNGAAFIGTSTGDSIEAALTAITDALNTHKSSSDHDGRYFTEAELQSTTSGASGAHLIGGASISGIPAGTLYSQLVALKNASDGAVTGAIPDGSLTDAKLSDSPGQIKDQVSTLRTDVNAHLADNANPHNVTKTQVGLGNVDNNKQATKVEFDSHVADYVRQPGYGTAVGVNNKDITLSPAATAYVDGMCVSFKNSTANTGVSQLNINGLGNKPFKKSDGTDFGSGELKAGSIYTARYNATTGNFIVQGEGGGKRQANGTGTTNSSGVLTVSGLTFMPKIIIATFDTVLTNKGGAVFNEYIDADNYSYTPVSGSASSSPVSGNVTRSGTGFTIKCTSGSTVSMYWTAIE